MTGLETAFAIVNHLLPELSDDTLVKLFSLNARNIFNLPVTNIQEGAIAELSLFTKKGITRLQKQTIKSKSFNTPFLEKELTGKVIGIINQGKIIIN